MKAVIMAGGFGTRIQPLTSSIPKPMLPVVNIPMMEHIVRKLAGIGITDFVFLLYFKADVIKSYFKDGKKWGIKINYVQPDDDYGTAGAVKKAENFLDERFIVVSGDVVTDFDFREIVGFHELKQSRLTITLTSVEDPLQFGIVITDKDGKVIRFLEKPGWGEVFTDTVNTGIYVIEPEILRHIPPNQPFDFSKDLFPLLMRKGVEIYGFKAKGYWKDVGNPDSYREVHSDILDSKVKIEIDGDIYEFGEAVAYVQGSVEISESAKIKGVVVLGDGVKIEAGAEVENSVIGAKTQIGSRSKVSNCVIWDRVSLGNDCFFKNAVVCNDVQIGNYVKAPKGVVIAEKVKVEDNVSFERDVTVWPEKLIESGAIVSSNLVWAKKWKRSIFEGGKISGKPNAELSPELAAKLGAALGSLLPEGSTVVVSRDYHRASRMIKRAFLGGLLSTGVNAVDLRLSPLPIMRFLLQQGKLLAGVHFRQSTSLQGYTEIVFYDENGTPIDTSTEKKIERIFFRERFRRVSYSEVGLIRENKDAADIYLSRLKSFMDHRLRHPSFRVVADLMNGSTSQIYPDILNHFKIDSVILGSYFDESRLSSIPVVKEQSIKNVSDIVKALSADAGFIIYPNGQKLFVVSDEGLFLQPHLLLLVFLLAIDKSVDRSVRAYVPVACPNVVDNLLENLVLERGKLRGLKANAMRQFYFIGDLEGNFVFSQFSLSADAMFSSVKLLEMLSVANLKISDLLSMIPNFYFSHFVLSCPSSKKAKVMGKLAEEAMRKEASFADGVKIFEGENWILFIPDQFSDNLHVFIQASSEKEGKNLFKTYKEKIDRWLGTEN